MRTDLDVLQGGLLSALIRSIQLSSDSMNMAGKLLREVVEGHDSKDDLVGHNGGDDYVVLMNPDRAEELAKAIICDFDSHVPELYQDDDLRAGFVVSTDRHGIKRSFPLLTISIAITLSEIMENPFFLSISQNSARMKERLKRLKNRNYLIDRRKEIT